MKTEIRWVIVAATAWVWAIAPTPAVAGPPVLVAAETDVAQEEDEYEGLPPGSGRDETFGMCGACHSMKLVVQQGLSRSSWTEVLEYMVEEHEMPELEPEDHKLILDYLTKFYGPDRRARQ
jgi:hypothetical protein